MKRIRIALLAAPVALLFTVATNSTPLRAQTQSPTPIVQSAPEAAPAPTAEAKPENESAKEETAQPPVKLFGIVLNDVGKYAVQVVNFGIFFAILFFILKGMLSSAFKARAKELEEQLAQAEKDKAEGEAQLKELEAKMAGMQKELEGIMAKAESEAEAEKQRILDAAKAEAALILAQTQSDIDFQKRLAEKELRALVAELAVEGATKRLEAQVKGTVAEQVLNRAIQEVGGAK